MSALLEAARTAALASHSPYSRFRVGAAVRAGGQVFTGCNVENASFGLTICAERNAVFAAVAAGHRRIEAIALACIDAAADAAPTSLMPCGACRQVFSEFAGPDLPIEIDRAGRFTLADLLPQAFRLT